MKSKLLLLFLLAPALAFADAKLTNVQANELLTVLSQVGPGLTAQNTTRIARDINALRPIVEAWAKGDQAARERLKITAGMKNDAPEALAYLAEAKKNGEDSSPITLQPVIVSDEEITSAKITPATLAVFLLYLSEPAKKNP
jgi:hypothetical protein